MNIKNYIQNICAFPVNKANTDICTQKKRFHDQNIVDKGFTGGKKS